MDKRQKSKLKMSNSIDNAFIKYQEEVDKDPGLKNALADFNKITYDIDINGENQL